jgi:hypothetical protein
MHRVRGGGGIFFSASGGQKRYISLRLTDPDFSSGARSNHIPKFTSCIK